MQGLEVNQRFQFGLKVVLISVAARCSAAAGLSASWLRRMPNPTHYTSQDIPQKQTSCLQITTKDKQPENSLSLFFVENFVSVVNKNCLATTRRTHNRPALTRRSPRLTLIRSLASHDAAAHSLCNGFALAPMLTDHVLKQVNQMHEMNKSRKATWGTDRNRSEKCSASVQGRAG